MRYGYSQRYALDLVPVHQLQDVKVQLSKLKYILVMFIILLVDGDVKLSLQPLHSPM